MYWPIREAEETHKALTVCVSERLAGVKEAKVCVCVCRVCAEVNTQTHTNSSLKSSFLSLCACVFIPSVLLWGKPEGVSPEFMTHYKEQSTAVTPEPTTTTPPLQHTHTHRSILNPPWALEYVWIFSYHGGGSPPLSACWQVRSIAEYWLAGPEGDGCQKFW